MVNGVYLFSLKHVHHLWQDYLRSTLKPTHSLSKLKYSFLRWRHTTWRFDWRCGRRGPKQVEERHQNWCIVLGSIFRDKYDTLLASMQLRLKLQLWVDKFTYYSIIFKEIQRFEAWWTPMFANWASQCWSDSIGRSMISRYTPSVWITCWLSPFCFPFLFTPP